MARHPALSRALRPKSSVENLLGIGLRQVARDRGGFGARIDARECTDSGRTAERPNVGRREVTLGPPPAYLRHVSAYRNSSSPQRR